MSKTYQLGEMIRFIDGLWGIEREEPKKPQLKLVVNNEDVRRPIRSVRECLPVSMDQGSTANEP